jgi:hypothetical protein
MDQRFPAVSDRVRQVFGLRLPRHLAVFCALWHSADDDERRGIEYLMANPFGVTEYFGDNGLRLIGRDGLDERLHGRFRRDPAEFVTVMAGDSPCCHRTAGTRGSTSPDRSRLGRRWLTLRSSAEQCRWVGIAWSGLPTTLRS